MALRCPPVHTEMGADMGAPKLNRTCEATGCTLPHRAFGFCAVHYQRLRRWGDTRAVLPYGYRRDGDYPPTPHDSITASDVNRLFYQWMQTAPQGPMIARIVAANTAWEASARERDARDAQLYPHLFEPQRNAA